MITPFDVFNRTTNMPFYVMSSFVPHQEDSAEAQMRNKILGTDPDEIFLAQRFLQIYNLVTCKDLSQFIDETWDIAKDELLTYRGFVDSYSVSGVNDSEISIVGDQISEPIQGKAFYYFIVNATPTTYSITGDAVVTNAVRTDPIPLGDRFNLHKTDSVFSVDIGIQLKSSPFTYSLVEDSADSFMRGLNNSLTEIWREHPIQAVKLGAVVLGLANESV